LKHGQNPELTRGHLRVSTSMKGLKIRAQDTGKCIKGRSGE
jgi:hypothetical protein